MLHLIVTFWVGALAVSATSFAAVVVVQAALRGLRSAAAHGATVARATGSRPAAVARPASPTPQHTAA